jgi:hypothetical protein
MIRSVLSALAFAGMLLISSSGPGALAEEPSASLQLERAIPLPGVEGRIDHMTVDVRRQVLFIAEVGAGALDAVNLETGARVGRVEHLEEPQGVAFLQALDQVAVACGGDGTVRFYEASDLRPVGVVKLEGDADNLRLDQRTGMLIAADGKGFSLIDPIHREVMSHVIVGAHPEGFQIDEAGARLVANVPDQRRIVVVDPTTKQITASWDQKSAMNFPMALSGTTAAAVFRAPAQLIVLDLETAASLAQVSACGDSDDLFFDGRRSRLYVTCGAGRVQVFDAKDHYRSLGVLNTRSGARTSLFVPAFDRLFVAARAADGQPASILVLRPIG